MKELPMNVEEQLIKLVEGVSNLTAKVDGVQRSVEEMKEISKTVTAHGTRIGQIEEGLKRHESKFDKIESMFEKIDGRVDNLEKAEGEKAKATIATLN